ncbi:MAG: hypothetical protein L0220_17220 [Acidobacteria bacterium]|nr:hypothetical protein [Acidobacteriota bacterium]
MTTATISATRMSPRSVTITAIDKLSIPNTLSVGVGLEGGTEGWLADKTTEAASGPAVVLGVGVISGVAVAVGLGAGVGVGVAAGLLSRPDLPDGVS